MIWVKLNDLCVLRTPETSSEKAAVGVIKSLNIKHLNTLLFILCSNNNEPRHKGTKYNTTKTDYR